MQAVAGRAVLGGLACALGLLFNPTSLLAQPAPPGAAPADPGRACQPGDRANPARLDLRLDNDLLGGQDEGYSSGMAIGWVSPRLDDWTEDPCLHPWLRALNGTLGALQPAGPDGRTMTLRLGQAIFTPADGDRRDLIEDDRPYAGLLAMSIGWHGRRANDVASTQLALGLVGPWAGGQKVQGASHHVLGSTRFRGWRHQLHNEPVFQLAHERARRWDGNGRGRWDVVGHVSGAVGTISTYAQTGLEWRWGTGLPDDFGSSPLRIGGADATPRGGSAAGAGTARPAGWAGHVFVTLDGRWVLRDITLDGNTWRDSHRVHRRPLQAQAGYGFVLRFGAWRMALARFHRTREFDGQPEAPVFGSLTVGREY